MDFHGVKKAVTHFVMQFTHVSTHCGVYNRKQKQLFRENCFENMVSDLKQKISCVSKKLLLEKRAKTKKTKNKKP